MSAAQCTFSFVCVPAVQCPRPGPVCLQQQQRMEDTGWTRDAVYNWANALSMGRLLSGPAIAYMIMHGMWAPAVGTLAVAGRALQSALACSGPAMPRCVACLSGSHFEACLSGSHFEACQCCMIMHGMYRHWQSWTGFQLDMRKLPQAQSRPFFVVCRLDDLQLVPRLLPTHDLCSSSPPRH